MKTIRLKRNRYDQFKARTPKHFELCAKRLDWWFPEVKGKNCVSLDISSSPLEDGYPFSFNTLEGVVKIGVRGDQATEYMLYGVRDFLLAQDMTMGYFRFRYNEDGS